MATRFIFVGDPHFRGTNPRNRKDDYKAALVRKLYEIFELAAQHQVEAVIFAGDMFDLPDVANSVLNEFADVLNECPVPMYTTAGNHDIPGYNIQAYANTSLRLLERIVPRLHVINDPAIPQVFIGDSVDVAITFTPYSGKIDVDGYGYSPGYTVRDAYRIHVAHGMLLDHTPPFDRFTLVQEVKTTANMVLTGHDHTGYGVYQRGDGVIFCNPGSLTRLSASESEIKRTVQVALITVLSGEFDNIEPGTTKGEVKLIPLKSAAPGEEVLDRSKIEADQARQYAMENFAALIQTKSGDRVLLDIPQIVDTITEQEGLTPQVRDLALEKIEAARMALV